MYSVCGVWEEGGVCGEALWSLVLGGLEKWILRGEGDDEGRRGSGGEGGEERGGEIGGVRRRWDVLMEWEKENQEVKLNNGIRPSALFMKHRYIGRRRKKERRKRGLRLECLFCLQLTNYFQKFRSEKINEFPDVKSSTRLIESTHLDIVSSPGMAE